MLVESVLFCFFLRLKGGDIPGLVKAIPKSNSLKHLTLEGNPFNREDAFVLLSLFETPITLKTLCLRKEFWHNDAFLSKVQEVLHEHPEVQIIYQPTRIRRNPVPVKMKQIVVDRINFLSTKAMNSKKKKQRWDFAKLMIEYRELQAKGEDPLADKDQFRKTLIERKFKLPKDTIEHLMDEFLRVIPSPNPKRKPKTKVDLGQMSQYYLNRFKMYHRNQKEEDKTKIN